MLLVVDSNGNVLSAATIVWGPGIEVTHRGNNVWRVSNIQAASEIPDIATMIYSRTLERTVTRSVTRPVTSWLTRTNTQQPWVTRSVSATRTQIQWHTVGSVIGGTVTQTIGLATHTQTRTALVTQAFTVTQVLTKTTPATVEATATVTVTKVVTVSAAAAAACPSEDYCDNTCNATYSLNITTGVCFGPFNCSGLYTLTRTDSCWWAAIPPCDGACDSAYCQWCGTIGPCAARVCCKDLGVNGVRWTLAVGGSVASWQHCCYRSNWEPTGDDCPDGSYNLTAGGCSACQDPVVIY